jgi:uncharacterized SAM-binding protein YcdF (DUF218 family)
MKAGKRSTKTGAKPKRRRLWLASPILLVVLAVAVFHAWALTSLAKAFMESQPPRKADAIVVLSGEANGEREAHAAELYNAGYAPWVVAAGPVVAWGVCEAKVMASHMASLGVPEARILLETRGMNTYRQAEGVSRILRRLRARTVLLVTSPTHSRRAGAVFRQVLGPSIEVISCPVPLSKSRFRLDRWWTRYSDVRYVVGECVSWVNRLVFRIQ